MPHSPTPARRRDRSWPQAVMRGLFAFITLAALVVGVPALLLAVGTLPATVPTLDEAREVLLSPDNDGSGLLTTMSVAAWIAWLWLTIPVLIEIIAVMARRTTPRLPGMATGQRLAGFLLGSIVLASPAAAASAATPAVAATAPHAPSTDAASTQQSAPTPTAAAEKTAPAGSVREFTVGAEDTTWWELAEQLLRDGTRYTELQRLNPEVPTTATVVPQGTTLRVPGHAEVHREAPDTGIRTQLASSTHDAPGESGGADVVTVKAGDSLSEIAAEELHDGSKWPQLFEASRGTAQPDGLPKITDPNMIYPGQQVTVPGEASERPEHPREDKEDGSRAERSTPPAQDDTEREPDTDTGVGESTAPSQSATSGTETPVPSESSGPAEQPGEGQGAVPTGPSTGNSATSAPESGEPSSSDTHTTPASESPASSPVGQSLQLRMVLGAGALLAASVTGALATRRMLQRRRRKPGETIAIASETSSAEAQLAAAAEPDGSARLDVALRTLAHGLEDEASLPGLRAARIGGRSLEVLPEDLALDPPAPFTAGRDGWWVLPGDAELLDEEAAREVPAPYPGLVTIGSAEDGDLLLVNLAQLPALLLDGDPTRITEVCTSLAVEIGMSPWGGVVEVVAVGFGEDLPRLLPTSRVMHMREAVHALRDLSERLLEVHQMPETSHHPYLLLCAASLDGDTAWQFADVIDKARIPVTLVAPAAAAAAHFPDAEVLNAELDELQQLDCAGTEITVQRLERAAYQQIATALAVSGQPAAPAEGPWEDVPDEPEPEMTSPSGMAEPDDHVTGAGTFAANGSSVAPVAPVTVHASDSEVFPALLAASADPAGLRLLPAAPPHEQDDPDEDQALAAEPAEGEVPEEPDVPLPEPDNGGGVEESEAHDLHAPEIRVLGPVEVDGVAASGHGPRIAQLAALLYFRPGRSADALCADMDPLAPWSSSTLNARLRGLRSALGNDPSGNAYVPRRRTGDDPYRLSPAVRCDWTRFLQLAERALPQGPAGLPDLERALGLVRGKPFGSRPLPWAGPFQQEMITRIIDVAHTVATHRTPAGPHHDLTAARQAIATGLDADNSAELLYRDWMRVEHAAGNRSGLHTAITQVQQVNRALDCDLEMETEQLINDLLHGNGSVLRKAQ
ncbi:LysM peptidoglycan-binding domain-containing protein [Streptomyces caniscabiei]|uniref:LysM peptidoglycan-binding domain-containing protein n=1 Tax=Streptomyces caniscabiei TaxID=2746961 RepID=UPI000A3863CF|nr:LysM peptidoglycan-binding domain-containing protein [Streptomyces caniscabiei]